MKTPQKSYLHYLHNVIKFGIFWYISFVFCSNPAKPTVKNLVIGSAPNVAYDIFVNGSPQFNIMQMLAKKFLLTQ